MNFKEELKKRIEEIEIDYNYEETYNDLYNNVNDYMNETQDFSLEYLFEEFIDYDTAEYILKEEINRGGLSRARFFLGDVYTDDDLYIIDGYGNLQNVHKDDLEYLKKAILDELEDKC